MQYRQLLKRIKKEQWWTEQTPGNYQQALPAWRAFILQSNIYGPKILSLAVILYQNDFLYENTLKKEKLAQFYKVFEIFKKNPNWLKQEYKKFNKIGDKLIALGENFMQQLPAASNSELANLYHEVYSLYTQMFTHSIAVEAADVYGDLKMLTDLRKAVKNSKVNHPAIAMTLASYPMLSFMEQERLEFLKLSQSAKPDFKKFADKFHWVQNNYLGAKFLNAEYFKKTYRDLINKKSKLEIKTEIRNLENKVSKLKKDQQHLARILHLDKNTQSIFGLLRLFNKWQDQRKMFVLHGIYYVDSFLHEASQRTKVKQQLLGYCTEEEIIDLLKNNRAPAIKELHDRLKLSVYISEKKGLGYKGTIFTGAQAKQIFKLFEHEHANILNGFVACAPVERVTGKVQVIINPHKEKFIANRILVTTMTRPDFVPLMRKARAIITDEGGITSHAAILSRELGIPCIIGTKLATKALKTGDLVEINLNQGEVKKL